MMQIYKVVMPSVKVVVKSMVKVIAMGVVLPVLVGNAWGQSERDDVKPPSFCVGLDLSEEGYTAAEDADEKVKIRACQWLLEDDKGREYNANDKKRGNDEELYFGGASSQFSPDDSAEWAVRRKSTYQRAYIDLQQRFGFAIAKDNIDKKLKAELLDTSDTDITPQELDLEVNLACRADETESEWTNRVTKKTEALLEVKLDKELEKEGVDVGEFDADFARKYSIGFIEKYRNSLETKITSSFSPTKLSGLVIVNTFEVVEGGESSIGILARWSNKVYDMTAMMDNHNGNLPASYSPSEETGKTIDEWLTEFEGDLSSHLGVRTVRDEKGYPLLFAFGHSAQRYYGTDKKKRKRAKDKALRISKLEAKGQLSDYVAAQVTFSETVETIAIEFDGYQLFDEDGRCSAEPIDSNSLKQSTASLFNSKSKLKNFGGIREQFTVMVKHPLVENANIAVSVMTWSPDISTKPETVSKEIKPVTEKISGSLSGTAVGNAEDF